MTKKNNLYLTKHIESVMKKVEREDQEMKAAFIYATVICGVTLITLYSITVAALSTPLFVSNTLATQVSCSYAIPITIMGLFVGAGVCLIIKFLQCFPYYKVRE